MLNTTYLTSALNEFDDKPRFKSATKALRTQNIASIKSHDAVNEYVNDEYSLIHDKGISCQGRKTQLPDFVGKSKTRYNQTLNMPVKQAATTPNPRSKCNLTLSRVTSSSYRGKGQEN